MRRAERPIAPAAPEDRPTGPCPHLKCLANAKQPWPGKAVRCNPVWSEARARLLIAIATARDWLDQLVCSNITDLAELALREKRSGRSVRMILSLAFLAPDIVTAAITGTLPRGLGLSDMTDLPMDWAEQRKALGLAQPTSLIDA